MLSLCAVNKATFRIQSPIRLLLAVVMTATFSPALYAQLGPELFSRTDKQTGPETVEIPSFGKQAKPVVKDPYRLKDSHQVVDKNDIDVFVKQIAGAGKGTIIESEREEIIQQFETKYGVFLNNRDVLSVSNLNAEGMVNALEKSLNQSNTNRNESTLQFPVERGYPDKTLTGKAFNDLEPYNKQAYLNSLRFGNVPEGVRMPGLTPDNNPSGGTFYSPSGSQKNIGLTGDYRSQISRSPYPNGRPATPKYATNYEEARAQQADQRLVNQSGIPTELYRKLSQDPQAPGGGAYILKSLEEKSREFYSNGRPRFDSKGREIYPNGRRKFNDEGTPLYSNGRPRINDRGLPLHSNGQRMVSADGRKLYSNGAPKQSKTGQPLFRDGSRKWAGDGYDPVTTNKQYREAEPGSQVPLATEVVPGEEPKMTGRERIRNPSASNAVAIERKLQTGRPLYDNGQTAMTKTGVKLHPNGQKRFSGDGIGSPEESALPGPSAQTPQGNPAGFVQRLYENGRPAYNRSGDRIYSDGNRRNTEAGQPLYPNGRRLANRSNNALSTAGTTINGTTGFQGRAQGQLRMYQLLEGQIAEVDDQSILLKLRGKSDTLRLRTETAAVGREADVGVFPGQKQELIPRLNVQVVAAVLTDFVDGRQVSQAPTGEALAIIATNPRVGRNLPEGDYTVVGIVEGTTQRSQGETLLIRLPNRQGTTFLLSEATQLQQEIRGETVPRDIRLLGVSQKVQVVYEQAVRWTSGKLSPNGPKRAIAVLED